MSRAAREIHLISKTDGPFGSALKSSNYADDGARVIRLGNIGRARFSDLDRAYVSIEYFQKLRQYEVLEGDLLVAALGDENHPLGRSCVARGDLGPAIAKADCFRLRINPTKFEPKYVALFLSSSIGGALVALNSRGATRSRINLGDVAITRVPRPPLATQREIVARIEHYIASHGCLRDVALRAISRFQERRQALITAAVTGQIDVSQVAA